MKKYLLFAVSVILLSSAFVFAQDNKTLSSVTDTYVISAKAGGVNHIEGQVSIVRKEGKSGLLLRDDNIGIGDKVSTGADGRAEILLNPGSFARLAENSQFEFITTDLDNLKLKLSRGIAIFEVYADNEFKVSIGLPDANIELTESGVYRIDVLPDGSGKLSVWKGNYSAENEKAEVKAGRTVVVKGKNVSAVAKFDRDNKDSFDLWSQLRAKEASAINKRLQRNALSNSLLASYNRGGWNRYNTFGLWVFDPFTRRWSFLPFGSGWYSPYGYGYGFDLYRCRMPDYVYYNPPVVTPTNPTNNNNQMTPEQIRIREERRQSAQTPTFQRFENNQREERGGGGVVRNNNSETRNDNGGWRNMRTKDDSNDTRPTYMPAPQQSNPMPSTPIRVPTTKTETKDNGKGN